MENAPGQGPGAFIFKTLFNPEVEQRYLTNSPCNTNLFCP